MSTRSPDQNSQSPVGHEKRMRCPSRSRSRSRSSSVSRSRSRSRSSSCSEQDVSDGFYSRSASRSRSPGSPPSRNQRGGARGSPVGGSSRRGRSRSPPRERKRRSQSGKDPRDKSTRQIWTNEVYQLAEVMKDAIIHFCNLCDRPIFIYGRMIPCKHVLCYNCGNLNKNSCTSCKDSIQRMERAEFGTIFMCFHGGTTNSKHGCRRTYLSQRDLQAHIDHRHKKLTQGPKNPAAPQMQVAPPSQTLPPMQQNPGQAGSFPGGPVMAPPYVNIFSRPPPTVVGGPPPNYPPRSAGMVVQPATGPPFVNTSQAPPGWQQGPPRY